MHIKSPQLKPVHRAPGAGSPAPKKKSKGKLWIILIIALTLGGFFVWKQFPKQTPIEIEEENSDQAKLEIKKKDEPKIFSYTIQEGDIPAEVFSEHGNLDANQIANLISASEDVYDLTNIKIGKNIDFCFDEEDQIENIKYYPNTEDVIIVKVEDSECQVKKEKIPYETKEEILSLKIDEFLYKDALDAGLSEASILEIADIFSFDIDFTTEIRVGDELKVFYEKRTLDGEPAPDGKILAAKFVNDGQEYFAYYFETDDEGSHYDGEGRELVRQFLRAPLSYRRITSGYTGSRLHPITKKVTAHYQIDYAAPTGTPVVSTAKGTVTTASWQGGWGNIVRVRHDNGYSTHYGHLSKYAKGIRVGASVSQGQVIGYVGSTGWSTGPHLDYGMKLNGAPINPLSLKLPKGIPLSGAELEEFQARKLEYEEKLK